MDPSPTLKQFLMLKPKNKGEREKAEEGGQWGDVTGSRDPSFRRPPPQLPLGEGSQVHSRWREALLEYLRQVAPDFPV